MERGDVKIFNETIHVHRYLKSIVYGGLDGIITTFAVVAGVVGANLAIRIVLILGLSNLIADGISMAIGDYLSTKASKEYDDNNIKNKKTRVKNKTLNKKFGNIPLKNSIFTFSSFVIFGFIPLVAYIFSYFYTIENLFLYSLILTAIALFILGSIKSKITGKNPIKSGIEMLIIGGIAAGAAYYVGYLISGLA